ANVSFELVRHEGGWWLKASNTGGSHAQLSAVSLMRDNGQSLGMADGLLGYALAGSSRAWPLRVGPDVGLETLRLRALLNGSPIELAVSAVPLPTTFAHR